MPTPAAVRPIPSSYYYSGQGRLGVGTRNKATGQLDDVVFVGNVTTLAIDVTTTKFEHKESMDGNRSIDLTLITEKKAAFKFSSESLQLDLLATAMYGTNTNIPLGTAVTETHLATKGKVVPLQHVNVDHSTVVVTKLPSTVLIEGTDYAVDPGFGTIYILAGSTGITTPDTPVSVTYNHETYDQIDAFTQSLPPERYLRFEGLNGVNGDLRRIDIPRAAFDPITGLEFINADLGLGAFAGSILQDITIVAPGASQFFVEKRVTASLLATPA